MMAQLNSQLPAKWHSVRKSAVLVGVASLVVVAVSAVLELSGRIHVLTSFKICLAAGSVMTVSMIVAGRITVMERHMSKKA